MRFLRLAILCAMVCLVPAAFAADTQNVLIRAAKPYDKLVKTIQQMGGTVTVQYTYVNGIAATVPVAALPTLQKLVGENNLAKDEMISLPEANGAATAPASAAAETEISPSAAEPADYMLQNSISQASVLHAAGYRGTGIIIAVIDSGYRPMFTHVAPGRVMSGYSLVPGQPNAVDNANYEHGTEVAGVAAANAGYCFSKSRFAVAAAAYGAAYAPTDAHNLCSKPLGVPTYYHIPMIGSAPDATIYPVKIFPNSGASSPSSRTLSAMEHVLNMRKAYDADPTQGVNIKVVNMSLGGATSYAGRTLNDEMVEQLLNADIVTVISAGNSGFSTITGGSPGTSMASLTVGAASVAHNERIVRAHFYLPCGSSAYWANINTVGDCAKLYRPDDHIQIADFSARGPTHDGRVKPDVVASGVYAFTQGSGTSSGSVVWVSGTSFSAPETSGVAAVLRQAFPSATARQIRNAIIAGANPSLVPTGNVLDRGHGYIDVAAAAALLAGGDVPDTVELDSHYTRNLQANLSLVGVAVSAGTVNRNFTGILPGQTAEIAYQVPKNAGALYVHVRDVIPADAADQNVFFGDDVYLNIQGSRVHTADYRIPTGATTFGFDFIGTAGKTYTFDHPEEGIWRITPMGDWTNKGSVSFGVDIWTSEDSSPQHTAKAKIAQGEQHAYMVTVPMNTAQLEVAATWLNMNASYPINDIDVYLVAPDGKTVNYNCSTGNAPERCVIATPAAGKWSVVVDGYSVTSDGTPSGREVYTVRVAADGVVLH